MRVKCVTNDYRKLENHLVRDRLSRSIHLDCPMSDLLVGGIYSVVALHESDGGMWLMLHTVERSDYPYPYPVELFELVDSSLPPGWCIDFGQRVDGFFVRRISFREWTTDEHFYERLLDGDETAIAVYRQQRAKL